MLPANNIGDRCAAVDKVLQSIYLPMCVNEDRDGVTVMGMGTNIAGMGWEQVRGQMKWGGGGKRDRYCKDSLRWGQIIVLILLTNCVTLRFTTARRKHTSSE